MVIFVSRPTPFCQALAPHEVLVVCNLASVASLELASNYMEKRHIPSTNLLALPLAESDTISREEYQETLLRPVAAKIEELKTINRVAAIVLIHGVPLKIEAPRLSREEWQELRLALNEIEELTSQAAENKLQPSGRVDSLKTRIAELQKGSWRAAVDSELALVKAGEYPLADWIRNPYYLYHQGMNLTPGKDQVLLVARLDGPDRATVQRIIDDTLAAEAEGLQGKAYFDARWPEPEGDSELDGYRFYDNSLHRAAKLVARRMPVVLDQEGGLFAEGACPDAALYAGWYSLASYIDSFSWQKGAIGYHLASAECATLRPTNRSLWCLGMLANGAAAVIGPVNEPYVQGFPLPEIFFGLLSEGYMSLGEAYLVALPYISWQMVLVGDPLYQPFHPPSLSLHLSSAAGQ